jgi:hypothetical protein
MNKSYPEGSPAATISEIDLLAANTAGNADAGIADPQSMHLEPEVAPTPPRVNPLLTVAMVAVGPSRRTTS